jgi:hypothetical protein
MGGFVIPTIPWTLFATLNGLEHKEEPLAFAGLFQFSSTQLIATIDITSDFRIAQRVFSLRTMWIDNSGLTPGSGTTVQSTFIIRNTGQIIAVKPQTQGYYPIIAQDIESGANLQVTGSAPTAGGTLISVPVFFLNFDVPPIVYASQ